MQAAQTTTQTCYLLDATRITEKAAQRKATLVTDFGMALGDFYREARWESNFWEDMESVKEYRNYTAQLNDGEREQVLFKIYS